jgi:DNA gyrase subunit A
MSENELIFIASDAQLLHFPAKTLRAQGRAASGVAGINLADDAQVIFFGAVPVGDHTRVITAANSSAALTGTDPGSVKATLLKEFPAKGRATGGVRSQRFIRNEDQIYIAFVAEEPVASSSDGRAVDLPDELSKRDASGTALSGVIAALGNL